MFNFTSDDKSMRMFVISAAFALLFGIGSSLGLSVCSEFKNCQYDPVNAERPIKDFDWSKWSWTNFGTFMAGGILGEAIRCAILIPLFF